VAGGFRTSCQVTCNRHLKSLFTFVRFMHYFMTHYHLITTKIRFLGSGWVACSIWWCGLNILHKILGPTGSPVPGGLKPLQQSLYRG
jgi:hypothetical protein